MKIYAFADEASPSIDEQIAAMKRNGLNGLEIRGVDGENVSVISLNKAREVRRKLEDAGLSVWSIGSPIGKTAISTRTLTSFAIRSTLPASLMQKICACSPSIFPQARTLPLTASRSSTRSAGCSVPAKGAGFCTVMKTKKASTAIRQTAAMSFFAFFLP